MWMAAGFANVRSWFNKNKNNATVLTKNIALFAILVLCSILLDITLCMVMVEHLLEVEQCYPGKTNEDMGYPVMADFFFQVVFVATAASVISGTIAERMKLWPF